MKPPPRPNKLRPFPLPVVPVGCSIEDTTELLIVPKLGVESLLNATIGLDMEAVTTVEATENPRDGVCLNVSVELCCCCCGFSVRTGVVRDCCCCCCCCNPVLRDELTRLLGVDENEIA